jgi:hypothetical protein
MENWRCRGALPSRGTFAKWTAALRLRPSRVGIEFSEIEWEGAHAALDAELDRKSAGPRRPVAYYDGHTQ